jgi:uncharacterized lipoprotein
MKKNRLFKKISLILLASQLYACASTEQRIVIAPEPIVANGQVYPQTAVQLNVADLRTSSHVIQILTKDKAATLINSTSALSDILTAQFTALFTKQGLQVNHQANKEINIALTKALITVKQDLVQYEANSEIIIQVQVNNPPKILTKSFRIRGANEGPFSADIAVLSRDFNQQLATLINQIVTDTEIQNFITNTNP